MTDGSDSSRLVRALLGNAGFERAAVWSAAGFGVSYVAFDVVALGADILATLGVASSTAASATTLPAAAVVTAVTVAGVAAFGATGGGVLPAAALAYGPLAAALLRTIGPTAYALPVDEGVSLAVALGEPLAAAVAGAVADAVVGSGLGRAIAGIGSNADETAGSSSADDDGPDASGATADD